jgi:hypothetical protein
MDTLQANQQLTANQQLVSSGGRVNLVMQADGNLVIYRSMFGIPIWATNTWNQAGNHVVMQADGNLVVYTPSGAAHWSSGTAGHPGARVVMQDDGNLVVYSPSNQALWASNSVPDWSSPTIAYSDARGYGYVETSESWKQLCQGLPCFAALAWPGYSTKVFETTLKGQPAVIQLWKGNCEKFLGLASFPGGFGGEAGVYKRIPGHVHPALPVGLPPQLLAAYDAIGSIADTDLWWPAPELADSVEFTLTNPITGGVFFSSSPEHTYWNCKWMNPDSYDRYQTAQGLRIPWLPPWFPGNAYRVPAWDGYTMTAKVNGTTFTW